MLARTNGGHGRMIGGSIGKNGRFPHTPPPTLPTLPPSNSPTPLAQPPQTLYN
ncbi:MAG: hypothetical protein KDE56_01735 [Anaerolineales bacterium]|nr:hypothetical protein [Anaerolineales bacterium]